MLVDLTPNEVLALKYLSGEHQAFGFHFKVVLDSIMSVLILYFHVINIKAVLSPFDIYLYVTFTLMWDCKLIT